MLDNFLKSKIQSDQWINFISQVVKAILIIVINLTSLSIIQHIKFLWGILGIMFGTYLTIIMPNMCHYKLLATHEKFGSVN